MMLGNVPISGAPLASSASAHIIGYLDASDSKDRVDAFVQFDAVVIDAIEAPDGANISAEVTSSLSISTSEAYDLVALQTRAVTELVAAISEPLDIAAIQTAFLSTATLAATERPDAAVVSIAIGLAVINATDPPDSSAISVNLVGNLDLLASEAADRSLINVYGQWGEMIVPAATNWQLVA